jgi:hypothetical protein
MIGFFITLFSIIEEVADPGIRDQLINVYKQIKNSTKKMESATKFIDFFVHDILDYTLLNKEDKNFVKDHTVFNLKHAIQEII